MLLLQQCTVREACIDMRCMPSLQEARKLWQQACSIKDYAADLASIAEAHALLKGPQEPSIQETLPPPPAAAENGAAAASRHECKQEQQVMLRL